MPHEESTISPVSCSTAYASPYCAEPLMRVASISATAAAASPVQATGTPFAHSTDAPRQPTAPSSSLKRSTSEWQLSARASSPASATTARRNRSMRRDRASSGAASSVTVTGQGNPAAPSLPSAGGASRDASRARATTPASTSTSSMPSAAAVAGSSTTSP